MNIDTSKNTNNTTDFISNTPKEVSRVVIRFAGDSGDGMQLTGSQFTGTSATLGNSIATFPDFPAEIRAPQGTVHGVSGFQVQLGNSKVYTAGDEPDVLVAMNPAALKANLSSLKPGVTIIVNSDSFSESNLKKANFDSNPLEDNSLSSFVVRKVQVTKLTRLALEELELDTKSKDRCKNFFALGLMYWIYNRPVKQTIEWIEKKFAKKKTLAEANKRALQAGYNYGVTIEVLPSYIVSPAPIKPGKYRSITGNEAIAFGFLAASQKSDCNLFLGSYPITPASDILHELSKHKNFGVITFQAEDEIAAICSAIGASFAGNLAITSTSGPGVSLKSEAIGLAVKVELPIVIINIQRAGPSTGMPTKTEQADLLQAVYGRHGEAPLCVLAPASPTDCYQVAFEASRIALEFMTPVILLSDGYLANGSEPWLIPSLGELPKIKTKLINPQKEDPEKFLPYERDQNLVRKWAIPGMPFEHRLTGLETEQEDGTISYDPENHEKMTEIRSRKIKKISKFIPEAEVFGEQEGQTLLLSWGGTFGSIRAAVEELVSQEKSKKTQISHVHLRYLNPFPSNLKSLLKAFNKILIIEINTGQLSVLIKNEFPEFASKIKTYNKIQGKPFKVSEIKELIF